MPRSTFGLREADRRQLSEIEQIKKDIRMLARRVLNISETTIPADAFDRLMELAKEKSEE